MPRHRMMNSPASNASFSVVGNPIAKRKKDKKVDGRCFCGLNVVLMESDTSTKPGRSFIRCPLWANHDCKYFAWVDEIDGGWEGLARALIGLNNDCTFATHDAVHKGEDEHAANLKLVMKMGKLKGEIKTIRVWIICIAVALLLCFICTLYSLLSNIKIK